MQTNRYTFLCGLLFLLLAGCQDWRSTDQVEIRSEKRSPNGKFIAASFYCEGGGAAGYCYSNVSLRRASDELNQRDGLLGKHKTWSGFSNIQLRWIDDSNLEVTYAADSRPAYQEHNAVRVESKHGVTIHYVLAEEEPS